MVDVEEDSQPRAPDHADVDLTDETQDFRFLSSLSRQACHSTNPASPSSHQNHSATDHPSLPRRGEKDFEPHGTSAQRDVLASSRAAMHHALSHPRVHAPKSNITGTYHPSTGLTTIENPKGQHFRTMGKAAGGGRICLLPEEALYILERGNLDLRWLQDSSDPSSHMEFSLQSAYTELVDRLGLTLERYTVYAGLKRSGYIVQRGPAWCPEDCGRVLVETRAPPTSRPSSLFGWLYRLLFEIKPKNLPLNSSLVTLGLYRSYSDMYRLLAIIPFHDPTSSTQWELSTKLCPEPEMLDAAGMHIQQHTSLRPSFHVWKPRPDFKKSTPGPADFRIAVVNAREVEVPTAQQLSDLLESVPYSPPPETMDKQMYQKLKHGWRNVILAVVDQGVVSYIRIADAGLGMEKLYDRTNRGKGDKRGGVRGRGRGRGRGGRR